MSFGNYYCIPKRWSMGPFQLSFPPWLKPLVRPLLVGLAISYTYNKIIVKSNIIKAYLLIIVRTNDLLPRLRSRR